MGEMGFLGGNSITGSFFGGGKSTSGLFFREEDICRGKVYATIIGGSIKQGGVRKWIALPLNLKKWGTYNETKEEHKSLENKIMQVHN